MNHNNAALILTMNDEYYLPYVLTSIENYFTRFVIYNVGSKDKTPKIINWWAEKNKEKDILIRHLPNCTPTVQITFRNSMIAEADAPIYTLIDGDEIIPEESAKHIKNAAAMLNLKYSNNNKIKYGVVRRIEVSNDLNHIYTEQRTHHRLYHRDAWWIGTHPGERAFYEQNKESEIYFPHIKYWHFHNASRSSLDDETYKRKERKHQRTYHPGELIQTNILKKLPILQKPIGSWPVSDQLKKLQDEDHNAK